MHELCIATSIVEIAGEEAQRQGKVRVEAVHLKLGADAGVVKEALLFAWDLSCENTPVAGSRLAIEEVQGAALEVTAIEIIDDSSFG
jgi:hydrogenase nickel incorporation protein HypA/HybF